MMTVCRMTLPGFSMVCLSSIVSCCSLVTRPCANASAAAFCIWKRRPLITGAFQKQHDRHKHQRDPAAASASIASSGRRSSRPHLPGRSRIAASAATKAPPARLKHVIYPIRYARRMWFRPSCVNRKASDSTRRHAADHERSHPPLRHPPPAHSVLPAKPAARGVTPCASA